MTTEIYYFSGTGNTLHLARRLAEATAAKLIFIPKVVDGETIRPDAETVGIVFPVYYASLPNVIKTFAGKLDGIASKYIFALANFGGGKGASVRRLSRIIRSRGGRLSAVYGVHMPQNSFYKAWENHEKIIRRGEERIEKIAGNILKQKRVIIPSDFLFDLLQLPFQPLLDSLIRKHLLKITGELPETSMEDLIYLADRSFTTGEKCSGCGTCSQVCPVGNITMEDGKPVWLHHCENCLACYNFCPEKAITTGLMQEDFYYKNPKVKVSDMRRCK